MKTINRETWKRAKHFDYFRKLDMPHFCTTANVDITRFRVWCKENRFPFFLTITYLASRVANEIPEFRYRIRGEEVVEHEVAHPSYTIMTDEGVYDYLTAPHHPDLATFIQVAHELTVEAKKQVRLVDGVDRDDVLYFTSMPWVSFTSFMHPISLSPVDSIPRIAWGKYFEENGLVKMPLSVHAHHSLMDGEHVGRYYLLFQEYLDNMDSYATKSTYLNS
ncbi:chloramphenicol O-acetyltransferase type A [Thermoactinomyces sp. DSM 45891]|uniref:chloramphenicol acetyltransferase n=1 Tax=Thermoactinomyces sp. DSM 45891 TaxID=1761907 RepID=UPI000912BF0E|nr:chloramphenicol acetyltransferase [Thermoactinomyces sp. DSM 45891]SFX64546.1 chloramphenicol O-acetyltransferase type A [Thermoactinomyces sp. DSM 45891]